MQSLASISPVATPVLREPFPRSGFPAPETARRRGTTQVVALIALLVGLVYLVWRTVDTVDLGVWWVSVPLLLLEAHAFVGLAMFTTGLWDLDTLTPATPRESTAFSLAILIPTYNEPTEILLPVIAAAVSTRLAHETWVLDDGARPEVAALAARLGARYLARPTHEHAKAGNVNYALSYVGADLIAILDADHVPQGDFLVKTVGYFDDESVALVQTPQDFYNLDSFEHAGPYQDQQLFYRALQPGRNRWGAAFWCGTGAVVRATALRDVGGLATETVTEDIHTTIRLHRRGWRTLYHNEPLARGLAAGDAVQYLNQRLRWGTGAMQVLRIENPATVSGLKPMQRISYLSTLLGWFDAWRLLGYLLIPMVVLATGALPITAPLTAFLPIFLTAFVVQRYALRRLTRGLAPQRAALIFDLIRMPANLQATLRLFAPGERAFSVTAKGKMGNDRSRMPVPRLLVALLLATVLAAAWAGCTLAGLTPLHYTTPWAVYASLAWLAINAALLVAAAHRIRCERFGSERRAVVRFDTDAEGWIAGSHVRLVDMSLTGARYVAVRDLPERGEHVRVGIELHRGEPPHDLRGIARDVTAAGDQASKIVSIEFDPGQERERAAIAIALFANGSHYDLEDDDSVRPVAA